MSLLASHSLTTRDRMVAEARTLFAERGFYGVSIAQIAAEMGLTKQALLHHFGTKEKLYGCVLEEIAKELAMLRPPEEAARDPVGRLAEYFVAMLAGSPRENERYRLLMREILDNRGRAKNAHSWFLRPFLEELTLLIRAVPSWSEAPEPVILAALIQILGAVNYHAISRPTFGAIFGDEAVGAVEEVFTAQFHLLVEAVLRAGPAQEA